jgi:hypothetical protein
MENQRDDLVVILAGYASRMETFFQSNPGFRSRIAHHIDFPDYGEDELLQIAQHMLASMHYRFDDDARDAFADYLALRRRQPNFANARSVRNALDRARLRQANRIFAAAMDPASGGIDAQALTLLCGGDIRASRVFEQAGAANGRGVARRESASAQAGSPSPPA